MSLPSEMIFFDSDDNEIARVFVNIGWVFNAEVLPKLFVETILENKETWERSSKAVLYGVTITKEFVESFKDYPSFEVGLNALVKERERDHNESR